MKSLGLRATARALGVSHSYLARLAGAGTIPRNDDRTFDVEAVRAALQANTDPSMVRRKTVTSPGHSAVTPPGPVTTEADAKEAVTLILRVLAEEGAPVDVVDYPAARLAETILKARARDLALKQRRSELVELEAVKKHVAKSFIGYRQAMQRMPSRHCAEMAAKLRCDPGELTTELHRMVHATLTELSAPVVRT